MILYDTAISVHLSYYIISSQPLQITPLQGPQEQVWAHLIY